MANLDLLSVSSRVEAPFISATIAGKTFGVYNRKHTAASNSGSVDFPNFMQSLDVTKINGAVNTYTLIMVYAITPGVDPNFLEKIFSKAKSDRTMILKYGDASLPSYIYKEESTLITSVNSTINMQSNSITYTIKAVSQSVKLNAGTHHFVARRAKPSDVIKEMLRKKDYNLTEIFSGMWDMDKVESSGLIDSDDITVQLESKDLSLLDYLNYLVSCMRSSTDSSTTGVKESVYAMSIVDDLSGKFGGTYFTIKKVTSNSRYIESGDIYEINVGYSDENLVTSFNINDNDTYSILYDYSGSAESQSNYVYRINDEGDTEMIYSPNITRDQSKLKTTEEELNWWTNITQFPIKVSLGIKGLLKPAILMNYVRLNVLFFGRKHTSSGLYIITKQIDRVSGNGYQTTLELTRVGKDNNYQ